MKSTMHFFIDNWKLSLVLMIFIVVSGLLGLSNVRRESRPPVDFARATISTIYPGASPEEVEELVTIKIEDQIREVEGIKDVQSVSQANRSTINVRVDMDNVDTRVVMDDLQRAVQRVNDIPPEVLDPPLFSEANAKEIPIIQMALIGSNKDRQRDLLADRLKNQLEDSKGVAEARLSGFRKREFQILLNPKALSRNYIGISEVTQAVKERVPNIPAGYLKVPGDQKMVRVTGQIDNAKDLGDIIVRSNFTGQKVRIRDVGDVRDGEEDPDSLVRVNGKPATLLTVTKKAEADAIRTANGLRDQLNRFIEGLPEGFEVVIYDDEAERVEDRLSIVINNALTGLALVLIILLLFLPGSLGFMASLSLPMAIFASLAVMPIFDVNFHNITMLGLIIAIGMLVDNSVVISENYARLRLDGMDRQNAALKAVHQFWLPLLATVLTTIAAFIPMLVTKGVMGQFIMWVPIMVTIALVASLIEGFFLLPARLQMTIISLEKYKLKTQKGEKHTWFDTLRDRFEGYMQVAVRRKYLVFSLISVLLLGSVFVAVKFNRFELFPTEEVEYYYARFDAPISTTIESTDKWSGELAEQIIHKLGKEDIRYIIARAGMQRVGFNDPTAKNADYVGMLTLAIPREVAAKQDPQEILKTLRSIPKGPFESLSFDAGRNGPPVGNALQVAFRSNHFEKMKTLVNEFKGELKKIDGVVDLKDDEIPGGPEMRIRPHYDRMASLGLTTQDVGMALRTALQGAIADEISLNGEDFYIRVRYSDDERAKVSALASTLIRQPKEGKLIPLASIVDMVEEEGPAVRKHYDYKRSITVSSGVVPAKITSVALNSKARDILNRLAKDYPEISYRFGGEDESTKESMQSLKNAMLLAFFGIFVILVFLFRSFMKPLVVLSCIPLGLIGVSLAFWAHGRPLSFLAMIGIVGLAGVVVNSAIVLLSYISDLQAELNDTLTRDTLLARASAHRLRAVLVTSLTTIGGLFPTAYGVGGYDSLLVPMTLALAWGLVSGTLLTLIWVPCFYAIIEDLSQFLYRLLASRLQWGNLKPAQNEGETQCT